MIELKPIDRRNLEAILELKVAEGQRNFVATNAESMAQAAVMPELVPLAVYAGGEVVGFAMYCLCDEDDGECWLYRLMTDEKHQRKGYGRAAMEAVLRRVRAAGLPRIFLGVEPANAEGIALYQSLGFAFDGRVFGGEKSMMLTFK